MLSVCIPIYNYKIDSLLESLSTQTQALDVPAEIIFIDDGSEDVFRKHNRALCDKVRYIQLEKNIGRAAIRNQFLQHVNYDYLLFLDCDSLIINTSFLSNYIQAIKAFPNNVICGGRVYDEEKKPPATKMLRWKYGIQKESKPADIRAQNPNASFMTNNFVISKNIFEKNRFDERLVEYGHEDTLFGYELKKKGIDIIHIDNPVMNGDLESNDKYLRNTEKAITNLTYVLKYTGYDKALINDVTLLRMYYKYHNIRHLIYFTYVALKPLIKFLLTKGWVNLYLFDLYKMGFIIGVMKNQQSAAPA